MGDRSAQSATPGASAPPAEPAPPAETTALEHVYQVRTEINLMLAMLTQVTQRMDRLEERLTVIEERERRRLEETPSSRAPPRMHPHLPAYAAAPTNIVGAGNAAMSADADTRRRQARTAAESAARAARPHLVPGVPSDPSNSPYAVLTANPSSLSGTPLGLA